MNIMYFFKLKITIATLLTLSFLGVPLFFLGPHTAEAGITDCFSGFGGDGNGGSSADFGPDEDGGGTSGGGNEVPVKEPEVRDKTKKLERKEGCMDGVLSMLARAAARTMTQDIIGWINSGFKGQPGFVSNPKRFLGTVANDVSGAFIKELGLSLLCDPLKLDIQIALLDVRSYAKESQCTLSKVVDNMNAFYDDFNAGGWTAWIHAVQPQNNAFGSYFLAADEQYARVSSALQNARDDANQSRGFLSQYKCDDMADRYLADGEDNPYFETFREGGITGCKSASKTTPGSILASQTDFALTVDGRQILAADEIDEMITAIANTFFNKLITGGLASLTKEKNPALYESPYPVIAADLKANLARAIPLTEKYLAALTGVRQTLDDLLKSVYDRIACYEAVDTAYGLDDDLTTDPEKYKAKIAELEKEKAKFAKALADDFPTTANVTLITDLLKKLEDILAMITPSKIAMKEVSGSKQNGAATIVDNADAKARIVITVAPGGKDLEQLSHIHKGSCPYPASEDIEYTLTPVINGTSITTLDVSAAELRDGEQPFSIFIHGSGDAVETHVSCGDIADDLPSAVNEFASIGEIPSQENIDAVTGSGSFGAEYIAKLAAAGEELQICEDELEAAPPPAPAPAPDPAPAP